ncbi:hypothetical protein [Clostridium sp.]|uniref:hypothetical protein n=1 Tax=Clostridium sp. TaxID=1506 RepID=UPI003F3DEEA4
MISCHNCNATFSFFSRLKSVNSLIIKCDKCGSIYKMKYGRLFICINIFLIMVFIPKLKVVFPEVSLLNSVLISISIAIIWTCIVSFILSYFIEYEEIEKKS